MTAATFLVLSALPRVLTPSRSSMATRLSWVNIELRRRVAGAVQADDQAVADQHVAAHALEVGDVLDPRRGAGGAGASAERHEPRAPARRTGLSRGRLSGLHMSRIVAASG